MGQRVVIVDQFGDKLVMTRASALAMCYNRMEDADESIVEQCASIIYGINQGYSVVNDAWNY